MKAILQVSDRLSFELNADNQRDMFEELAALQEVFGMLKCEKCSGTDLKYVVRENADKDKFYELYCQNQNCRARFEFGSHKQTKTLFPKRKEKDGTWLPHSGWTTWDKEQQKRV